MRGDAFRISDFGPGGRSTLAMTYHVDVHVYVVWGRTRTLLDRNLDRLGASEDPVDGTQVPG